LKLDDKIVDIVNLLDNFSLTEMDEYYFEIQRSKDIEGQIQIAKDDARKEGEEIAKVEIAKKMLSKKKNIEEIIEFTDYQKKILLIQKVFK
jgi:L-arabinose isomerase